MSEEQLSEIVGGLDWNLGDTEGKKSQSSLDTSIIRSGRAAGGSLRKNKLWDVDKTNINFNALSIPNWCLSCLQFPCK